MNAKHLEFTERFMDRPFYDSFEKSIMLEYVSKSFDAYESGEPHVIDVKNKFTGQTDVALRFYQVTDFLHETDAGNAIRLSKLAKVCLDAQGVMKPQYWEQLMGSLYGCLVSQEPHGFRHHYPSVMAEFSDVLLNDSLHHENPSITKILCGHGTTAQSWNCRDSFTPSILKALESREDKARIIEDKMLRKVLDKSVPHYQIQGLAQYLSRRGKGSLLDDALGL
jgi:hypothetical protein